MNNSDTVLPLKPAIAVVGAGAVGGVIGGLLARAGENVTLIARSAHVEAINRKGLAIDGALGEFTVHVQAEEGLNFRPDLVLLTVKTQSVEATCEQIKPWISDAPVVTLQNGVRSEEIAASLLGRENIISGIVLFNAWFLNPGQVTYAVKGPLLIGEPFRANGTRVEEIAAILSKAVETKVWDNISGAHWTKLLTNVVGNGLEAITGLGLKECMRSPALRRIGVLILREALEVVERADVSLAPLPNLPTTAIRLIIKSPTPVASAALKLTMGSRERVTSTLQSIRRGRSTEIDYLNGEIVELGRKVNVATRYNAKVVQLVHEAERTHRFYSTQRLESLFSSP